MLLIRTWLCSRLGLKKLEIMFTRSGQLLICSVYLLTRYRLGRWDRQCFREIGRNKYWKGRTNVICDDDYGWCDCVVSCCWALHFCCLLVLSTDGLVSKLEHGHPYFLECSIMPSLVHSYYFEYTNGSDVTAYTLLYSLICPPSLKSTCPWDMTTCNIIACNYQKKWK